MILPTSHAPFNLVWFGSPSFGNAVQATLYKLQLPVKSIQGNEWLTSDAPYNSGHIVLAISSDDYPRKRLCSTIQKQQIIPVLAILDDTVTRWDSELLANCCELLRWPCRLQELSLRLTRGCGKDPLTMHSNAIKDQERNEFANLNLIGRSSAFLKSLGLIKKLSACEASVFIQGETGTGKELAARAIHYLGPRRDYPFIPVNCGAMPEHLLENELFGHERGAYTDAKQPQSGLIAQAHRGSLFLDEVESISHKAQVALLRFLQGKEYKPLGCEYVKQSDVRIIAASNADLTRLLSCGAIRQDFYYRLNVMILSLPPLRERDGDIEELANHFLSLYCTQYGVPKKMFHSATSAWMKSYSWPGNVRELDSFVHRAFLLSNGPFVHLPATSLDVPKQDEDRPRPWMDLHEGGLKEVKAQYIEQFEKHYLKQLLAECQGNISLAARRAGKERRAFGKLLKKHCIERADYLQRA